MHCLSYWLFLKKGVHRRKDTGNDVHSYREVGLFSGNEQGNKDLASSQNPDDERKQGTQGDL